MKYLKIINIEFYIDKYKSDDEILLSKPDDKVKVSTTFNELKSIIGGLSLEKKLEIVDMFFSYRCGDENSFLERLCDDQIKRNKKYEAIFLDSYNEVELISYKEVSEKYAMKSKFWQEFKDKLNDQQCF